MPIQNPSGDPLFPMGFSKCFSLQWALWFFLSEARNHFFSFYQVAVDKLKASGSSQIPYKLIKELAIPDRPKAWSINSLKPKMDDKTLADDLAQYFSRIMDEFRPLEDNDFPLPTRVPFRSRPNMRYRNALRTKRKRNWPSPGTSSLNYQTNTGT